MKNKEYKEYKVYIEYSLVKSGGEDIDPTDRWSSREPSYTEVEFSKLYRSPPKHIFFYDSIEVEESLLKESALYLAVVRYSTGDTFGRSEGEFKIVDAFKTVDEANKYLEEITKPSKKGDYAHYKPWEGYFESLEGVEVHNLMLVD